MTLIAIAQLIVGEALVTPGGPVDTDTVSGAVDSPLWGDAVEPTQAVTAGDVQEPVPAGR